MVYDLYDNPLVSNPLFKEFEKEAARRGYELHMFYWNMYGDLELDLIPEKEWRPRIYLKSRTGKQSVRTPRDAGFEIKTYDFGNLDSRDYAKFVEGCNDAMALVSLFNSKRSSLNELFHEE